VQTRINSLKREEEKSKKRISQMKQYQMKASQSQRQLKEKKEK